jgi:hypothetical protein
MAHLTKTQAANNRKTVASKSIPATRKAKQAKAVASNANHITVSKNTTDNAYVYVEAGDGCHFTRLRSGDNKAFRAVSGIGMPYAAAERFNRENPAPKPQARLAKGVDGHNSPHSAKSVADQRKGTKAAPKTSATKAGKNKQPSKGAERSYSVIKGAENKARPDTWRYHMTAMIIGSTDTAAAKAKHAKSGKFPSNKLDFNWAANNGFIKFS